MAGRRLLLAAAASALPATLALGTNSLDNDTTYNSGTYGYAPVQDTLYSTSTSTNPNQDTDASARLRPPRINIQVPRSETPDFSALAPGTGYALGVYGSAVEQPGPVLLDVNGEVIWFGAGPDFTTAIGGTGDSWVEAEDIQVQTYKGESVLTFWNGTFLLPGYGKGAHWVLGQDYSLKALVTALNQTANESDIHEFRITPDDTALLLAWRATQVDLTSVGGASDGWTFDCVFQEIDIEKNNLIFEWRSLEHVPVSDSYFSLGATGVADDPYDYCHINSVDVDSNGDYLVSMRGPSAIYKVSKDTGDIVWTLGGKTSNFNVTLNETEFFFQHHARWHADDTQISIFDNGSGGSTPNEATARGLLLSIDQEAMEVGLIMDFIPTYGNVSGSQGSVQVLDNGNVVVGWGQEPYFTEYNSDGTVLYDVHFGADDAPANSVMSYRAFKVNWTAIPNTLPAIVYNTTDNNAYVSWNGATEIGLWQILAGNASDGSDLVELGERVSKTGFETAIPVSSASGFYAVAAMAANGTCLGSSWLVSSNGTRTSANASCDQTSNDGNNTGGHQSGSGSGADRVSASIVLGLLVLIGLGL